MQLFTWNMDKRDSMAARVLKHLDRLAQKDHVIATLQEWPQSLLGLSGHSLHVVPTTGRALILYSNQLRLCAHSPDDSERATIARFALPGGNEITCVGLHWHSRDSRGGIEDAYERGGAIALFRHHLEARLAAGVPAVIMGDFNASHHEQEMGSPYCLFALSKGRRSTPAMETMMGRPKLPWLVVEPAMPAGIGTYYWPRKEMWTVLDHVVLTPDLARAQPRAEVVTGMEGESFLTSIKRVPRGPQHASDHLPVRCEIHYQ